MADRSLLLLRQIEAELRDIDLAEDRIKLLRWLKDEIQLLLETEELQAIPDKAK